MFYADFLDNFGQRQGFYEQMAAKLEENREEDLEGVSPSSMTPSLESSISNSEHKGPH